MTLPPDPYQPSQLIQIHELADTLQSLQSSIVVYRQMCQALMASCAKLTKIVQQQRRTIQRLQGDDTAREDAPHFAPWYPDSDASDPPDTNVTAADIRWRL